MPTVSTSSPDGADPLAGLEPTHVIAMGESQSATYLSTYINAVHPLAQLFDGFLVHSRLGITPQVDKPALARGGPGVAPIIRTDLDVPTFVFSTETDLTVLGNFRSRQEDSDTVRLWEVAGTAHADEYLLSEVYGTGDGSTVSICPTAVNSGPHHQPLKAAMHHLVAWVREGTLPPTAPRLEVADKDGEATISRDARGNALGGIRLPDIEVPTKSLSGDPVEGGPGWCFLFGSTTPFDAATLAELYPSKDEYIAKVRASAEAAAVAGYILQPEADGFIAKAEASDIPG
jgi:Alpha/beta hydrolase domain